MIQGILVGLIFLTVAPTVPSGEELSRVAALSARINELPRDPEGLFRAAVGMASSDPETSVAAYSRAALMGHSHAAYFLGQIYETGDGVPADLARARAWYALAAGDINRARVRLDELPVVRFEDALGSPRPLSYSVDREGRAELIWSRGLGSDPGLFDVEFQTASGETVPASANVAMSAVRLQGPGDAESWRVVARGPEGTPAQVAVSSWYPISLGASQP